MFIYHKAKLSSINWVNTAHLCSPFCFLGSLLFLYLCKSAFSVDASACEDMQKKMKLLRYKHRSDVCFCVMTALFSEKVRNMSPDEIRIPPEPPGRCSRQLQVPRIMPNNINVTWIPPLTPLYCCCCLEGVKLIRQPKPQLCLLIKSEKRVWLDGTILWSFKGFLCL